MANKLKFNEKDYDNIIDKFNLIGGITAVGALFTVGYPIGGLLIITGLFATVGSVYFETNKYLNIYGGRFDDQYRKDIALDIVSLVPAAKSVRTMIKTKILITKLNVLDTFGREASLISGSQSVANLIAN